MGDCEKYSRENNCRGIDLKKIHSFLYTGYYTILIIFVEQKIDSLRGKYKSRRIRRITLFISFKSIKRRTTRRK